MVLRALALLTFWILLCGSELRAQTVNSGFVYGGATFGKRRMDGAGRFGAGLDFRLGPRLDLGGELGTIHKGDVGILASANLTYHMAPQRHREWDPFLTGGVSAARISGVGGLYVNLGAGANYWVRRRVAFRGEFRGYPGGQDLGGFAEFRFGVTFRP
jgi:hypothetical protein